MPTLSLLKRADDAPASRPSIKLKLAYGHMPVKRSINFAVVGEKPIDWRIAIPAIAMILFAVALVSKVMIYDRFAALSAARAEVYRLQAEINEKREYYDSLADISEDYAHYSTSEMTDEERNRISRVAVMDVAQRLISPVAPADGWTLSENILSIHISDQTLTDITEMVNKIQADPVVSSCMITSASTTASSTEKVATEETITAELQIVFKGMLQVVEENKAAKAAAEAAQQTVVGDSAENATAGASTTADAAQSTTTADAAQSTTPESATASLADAIQQTILDHTPDDALQVLTGDPLEGVDEP